MKITVIGPGAMGCLYAARLADAGVTTTLLDYKPERASRLSKSGLTVESKTGDLNVKINVSTNLPPKQNGIIVLTKSHATSKLRILSGVPVLTLQNGLGNVEALCELVGAANVIAGATSEASTALDEGRVRHAGSGTTHLGAWTGCKTDDMKKALEDAGFTVQTTDRPGQIIWEKAVICAAINPLTALLDIPNGKLLELREPRQLLRDLVVEGAKVAATEGYRFEGSMVEAAEQICRDTSENISSMLQDIRAGRSTEIEALTGEILRRGEAAALPTPRTRVVWQLLKGLERR